MSTRRLGILFIYSGQGSRSHSICMVKEIRNKIVNPRRLVSSPDLAPLRPLASEKRKTPAWIRSLDDFLRDLYMLQKKTGSYQLKRVSLNTFVATRVYRSWLSLVQRSRIFIFDLPPHFDCLFSKHFKRKCQKLEAKLQGM